MRTCALGEAEIPRFSVGDVLGKGGKQALFLEWLRVEGFAVLTLSEELQVLLKTYWDDCQVFFAKSMEHKRNFKGRSLNVDEGDDPSATENRRVFKGFLPLDGKELLKLCLDDPTQRVPEELQQSFKSLCEALDTIMGGFYHLAAQSPRPGSKQPAHPKSTEDVVSSFFQKGSFLTMFDYQVVPRPEGEPESGFYHCATHEDAGFLSFIMCSTVPALQIQDRKTGTWWMPETVCEPMKEAFIIVGKRMHTMADNADFLPTVHRVALPYGKQRHSIVYFQDLNGDL